jgi:ribose transport system substrate-binding protein
MLTRRQLILANTLLVTNCGRGLRKTLAVIPKANADLFFVTIHAGAEEAARKMNVGIAWNGPDRETDYGRQIEIVDVMITRRVDGLAISATDDRALVGPLQRVTQAGIPITIFDSAVNIDNYVSMVATDNHGAGRVGARLLAERLHGAGNVAMLMQKPGGTSTELREHGFEETLAKEFPNVQIVARQFSMGDRARAMAIAENFLTAHHDLAGIFASSEASSIGAIRAIRTRNLSGKVKLITFDVSDIHLEALRDGTVDVMLVQDAFRIGYEAVKSLADKLDGRVPARRLDIPARAVVRADLDKPEVQQLLNLGHAAPR